MAHTSPTPTLAPFLAVNDDRPADRHAILAEDYDAGFFTPEEWETIEVDRLFGRERRRYYEGRGEPVPELKRSRSIDRPYIDALASLQRMGLSAPPLTGQGIEITINAMNRAYARGLGIDLGAA